MRAQFRLALARLKFGRLKSARPKSVGALVAIVLVVCLGVGSADYDGDSTSSSYVVQPGDNLWNIAIAHHMTVWQLAAYNGLNLGAILPVGKHISFPSPEEPDTASSQSTGSQSASQTTSPAAPQTMPPASFCSSLSVSSGSWGVLPSLLQDSPSRLALRPVLEHWAAYYDLSAPLLEAVTWQESGWQQNVISSAGAVGVGQLMPGTAAFIQSNLVGEPLNIASTADNIRMAAAFLAYLAGIEGNNRCYTIAAYYEGPVNLAGSGVYPDTQLYVTDVEALVPLFS